MTTPASSAQPAAYTADASVRGRFLWFDLMTRDVAAATDFYTAVVGWTLEPFTNDHGTYMMFVAPGAGPTGGTMQIPGGDAGGAPPHWIAYVGTPDVDATYALALQLGATSHVAPRDIPTIGRFAVLSDPQGATFALFMPSTPAGPEPDVPGVGQISWYELTTTNAAAAFDFYQKLFGWEKTDAMDMGPMGIYQMYGARGHTYGGMMDKTADMPGPSRWTLYARVPDIAAAIATAKERGGQIVMGPHEVPGGDTVAIGIDPQGAAFALHQKKA